jgi:hypothetical protein
LQKNHFSSASGITFATAMKLKENQYFEAVLVLSRILFSKTLQQSKLCKLNHFPHLICKFHQFSRSKVKQILLNDKSAEKHFDSLGVAIETISSPANFEKTEFGSTERKFK